jgi:phosphatidate phosphatase APP1
MDVPVAPNPEVQAAAAVMAMKDRRVVIIRVPSLSPTTPPRSAGYYSETPRSMAPAMIKSFYQS